MPGFMRSISMAFLYGAGLGTFFYMCGGVASTFFPALTPVAAGALGFLTAAGIQLGKTFYAEEEAE